MSANWWERSKKDKVRKIFAAPIKKVKAKKEKEDKREEARG